MPPAPIDDPAGETSLLPMDSDFHLPETELIEPLSLHPALSTMPGMFATPPSPDERGRPTIARSSCLARRRSRSGRRRRAPVAPPAPAAPPSSEDTNPGIATRILIVSPNFAALARARADRAGVGAASRGPAAARLRPAPADGGHAACRRDARSPGRRGQSRRCIATTRRCTSSPHGDTHPVPSPVCAPRTGRAGGAAVALLPRAVARRRSRRTGSASAASAPANLACAAAARLRAARADAAGLRRRSASLVRHPRWPRRSTTWRCRRRRRRPSTRTKLVSMAVALAAVLLLALGVYQVLSMRSTSAAAPATATLSVESSPAGATVSIDGTPRGKTPIRLELSEGQPRARRLAGRSDAAHSAGLAAGTITAHSFEFAAPSAPVGGRRGHRDSQRTCRAVACWSTASRAASRRSSSWA